MSQPHRNCPDCKKHMEICDNDCGSYFCPDCKKDWYEAQTGVLVVGHVEDCGEDSLDSFGN